MSWIHLTIVYATLVGLSTADFCRSNCSCTSASAHCSFNRQIELTQIPEGLRTATWETVKLEGLVLQHVTQHTLGGMISVMELELKGNGIESVSSDAFAQLKNLGVLSLAFNRLKTLPTKLFNKAGKLYKLDLSYNMLCSLSGDVLPPSRNLNYLDVSGNRLLSWDLDICEHFADDFKILSEFNHLDAVRIDLFCPITSGSKRLVKHFNFNSNGLPSIMANHTCPTSDYEGIETDIYLQLEANRLNDLTYLGIVMEKECYIHATGILTVDLHKNCFCDEGMTTRYHRLNMTIRTDETSDPASLCGRNKAVCRRLNRKCDQTGKPIRNPDECRMRKTTTEETEPPKTWKDYLIWIIIGVCSAVALALIIGITLKCRNSKKCEPYQCRKCRPRDKYDDVEPPQPRQDEATRHQVADPPRRFPARDRPPLPSQISTSTDTTEGSDGPLLRPGNNRPQALLPPRSQQPRPQFLHTPPVVPDVAEQDAAPPGAEEAYDTPRWRYPDHQWKGGGYANRGLDLRGHTREGEAGGLGTANRGPDKEYANFPSGETPATGRLGEGYIHVLQEREESESGVADASQMTVSMLRNNFENGYHDVPMGGASASANTPMSQGGPNIPQDSELNGHESDSDDRHTYLNVTELKKGESSSYENVLVVGRPPKPAS